MRKGTDLIGKPIIAYNTGSQIATVKDLIFSEDQSALVALLTQEPGLFKSARILLIRNIQAIGLDGILIPSQDMIVPASQVPQVNEFIQHENILKGTQIMTLSGRNLGKMVDLYFNAQTGAVEGYEVSGGIFADAYTGRSFVPVDKTFRIGQDFAFVPDSVTDLMEEQVGGIKAAMIATSNKAQDIAHQASDKAQELSAVASEKLTEAQEKAATVLTDTVVTPEEQRDFAIGRNLESDVQHPDGSIFLRQYHCVTEFDITQAQALGILDVIYRATGGKVTEVAKRKASEKAEELSQNAAQTIDRAKAKTQEAIASYTIDETLGRRVQRMVYSRNGEVIAAMGQIVTLPMIELAKTCHREKQLMEATGLSLKEAAKSQTSLVGETVGTQAQQLGGQAKYHASTALSWMKHTADDLRERSTIAIEDQRIKGALGRPVNRVILDQYDNVLLNLGELVTHRAIAEARVAGVLDILLGSIYDADPQLASSTLKAPQNGRAALAPAN